MLFVISDPELPQSRNIPPGTSFNKQTMETMEGVLVCTGVYKEGVEPENEGDEKNYPGHRDFARLPELYRPSKICKDVHEALQYIMETEGMV